ncbi:MAG: mechanosensitive ion channel domain-containing protein, partial [Pseudomonadota bacterium]
MINTLTDQLQAIGNGAIEALPSIVIAGIVVLFTAVVARSARGIANRLVGASELRPSLQNLVVTLVRLGVWLSGLMIAALVVFPNFSPSSLIAGLGIGAVAIGFAFQDFFENFISGVMIMLRDTMQIGDVIKTGEIHGKVEFISLRESHIRAFSGELHVLPNSQLFKNPVEVITDKPKRRFEVVIGVSYDTDLDEADKAIREAVEGVDLIDKDE